MDKRKTAKHKKTRIGFLYAYKRWIIRSNLYIGFEFISFYLNVLFLGALRTKEKFMARKKWWRKHPPPINQSRLALLYREKNSSAFSRFQANFSSDCGAHFEFSFPHSVHQTIVALFLVDVASIFFEFSHSSYFNDWNSINYVSIVNKCRQYEWVLGIWRDKNSS